MIKTWQERRVGTQHSMEGAMLLEIDELRGALKERNEELQRTYECIRSHARITFTAEEKVQEQRKVLEQALEALQYCVQEAGPCEHECGFCVCKETNVITAIQGVLK